MRRVSVLTSSTSRSQAGSDPLLTMDNAQLNGVRSRLQLVTEPMLEMSLPGNSFDAVFCNVAIQKIASREARGEVVAQLFRVTKPGGQIRIVDTQFAKQHAEDLAALGAEDTAISALGIRGWYGNRCTRAGSSARRSREGRTKVLRESDTIPQQNS